MMPIAGIRVYGRWSGDDAAVAAGWLGDSRLAGAVGRTDGQDGNGPYRDIFLSPEAARAWTPDCDTAGLARVLGLSPADSDADLDLEIGAALLRSPIRFTFPSVAELVSAVRLRRRIVQTARQTVLAFETEDAERPDCWQWSEATGFVLRPGFELIPSLERTLWPRVSGRRYSFSCYRATEYVLLLALAQELRDCHPQALEALQAQWSTRAIQALPFQDAFLYEFGSLEAPLPQGFYIPGDRLWFRNPDERSASIEGYEGSWLFYLGEGRFANFWKPDAPYTLQAKCLELYHWRDGVFEQAGRLAMDEAIVEEHVAQTWADPQAVDRILHRMMRLRDPAGVYAQGGCIDASREAVRCLRPQTCALHLPGLLRMAAA